MVAARWFAIRMLALAIMVMQTGCAMELPFAKGLRRSVSNDVYNREQTSVHKDVYSQSAVDAIYPVEADGVLLEEW